LIEGIMSEPVRLALIGAGNRGAEVYGQYCLDHPDEARIVAIADPRAPRLNRVADAHGVPAEHRYDAWEPLLDQPRFCDAVVIATPDRVHVDPAVRALDQGYDILLEKPIAPSAEGVRRIGEAAARSGATITIAHVLRYTPFFSTLERLVREGHIGQLVSIQYAENIGYWHFAHSYVRGNWARSDISSPMILAKSCHDLDIIRWLAGSPCVGVSSFGGLAHFRADNRPEGAPERCIDGCPVADDCPYYAPRFYIDRLANWHGPPVTVITDDTSIEGRVQALKEGPYGRCVYSSDNDVADNQVVLLEFENEVTASLTVSAFTQDSTRTLKLMGSHGEIRGDLDKGEIEIRGFAPRREPDLPLEGGDMPTLQGGGAAVYRVAGVPTHDDTGAVLGAFVGHAGGDEGLMRDFVERLQIHKRGSTPDEAVTSLVQSLDSHQMAFAAEEARLEHKVIRLPTLRRRTMDQVRV
jgi:predicted dehydrogenase